MNKRTKRSRKPNEQPNHPCCGGVAGLVDYTEETLLELIERRDEHEQFYRDKLAELQKGNN